MPVIVKALGLEYKLKNEWIIKGKKDKYKESILFGMHKKIQAVLKNYIFQATIYPVNLP